MVSFDKITPFGHWIQQIATSDVSWVLDMMRKYAWAMEFLIVIFCTILLAYFENFVYHKASPKFLRNKQYWEHGIIQALHRPLRCFIWLIGVCFALDLAAGYTPEALLFRVVSPIRKVGTVLLFVWFMISFIKEIEKILSFPKEGKHHLDKTTIRAISQVLRVIVIVASIFIILQTTLGIGASAILAFAGGGSFIIGWAAKDMLANIFGGFMIFLDRPFAIGDRICSVDKSIEGYVEHIGWRLTRIRNLDKVPLYIPNSFFSSMSIENPSRMSHRRIYETIGIRYIDMHKVSRIVEDITAMLKKHGELDQEEIAFVNLTNCTTTALEILIYAFTKTVDLQKFYKVRQDVLLKSLVIIETHGAVCAFPITEGKLTVQLEK